MIFYNILQVKVLSYADFSVCLFIKRVTMYLDKCASFASPAKRDNELRKNKIRDLATKRHKTHKNILKKVLSADDAD